MKGDDRILLAYARHGLGNFSSLFVDRRGRFYLVSCRPWHPDTEEKLQPAQARALYEKMRPVRRFG
ncbi:MAG: hypothetical protein WCY82_11140 [Desulfotomaculaceae bacterium]